MRISDWSSDVCSSDLAEGARDLALADRLGAVVDEREHLFLAGEGRGADPFGLLWVRIPGAGRVLLAGQDQSAAVSSAAAFPEDFPLAFWVAFFFAAGFFAAGFLEVVFLAADFFAAAFFLAAGF